MRLLTNASPSGSSTMETMSQLLPCKQIKKPAHYRSYSSPPTSPTASDDSLPGATLSPSSTSTSYCLSPEPRSPTLEDRECSFLETSPASSSSSPGSHARRHSWAEPRSYDEDDEDEDFTDEDGYFTAGARTDEDDDAGSTASSIAAAVSAASAAASLSPFAPMPPSSSSRQRRPAPRSMLVRTVSCSSTMTSTSTLSSSSSTTYGSFSTAKSGRRMSSVTSKASLSTCTTEATHEQLRRQLRRTSDCYGSDHPKVALVLNQMGQFHCKKQNFAAAQLSFREALKTYRNHCSTSNLDKNEGSTEPTPVQHQQSLDAQQHRQQQKHQLSVALTLVNLSTVHVTTGRLDNALASLEEALTIRMAVHGERHTDVADTLHSLGQVHCLRGETEDALSVLSRALSIRRFELGSDHIDVARTLGVIGSVRERRGDLEDAMDLHLEALRIKKAVAGDKSARCNHHRSIVSTLLDIARVHVKRGEAQKSLELYQEALASQRVFLCNGGRGGGGKCGDGGGQQRGVSSPDDCIDVGVTLHSMGNVYASVGGIDEARKSYNEGWLMYREAGLADTHKCFTTLRKAMIGLSEGR